jgi:uncharacterized protein (DUF2132 family)
LHGLTLEDIVTALQAAYGWRGLAERIPLRCFSQDPSVASSLKLLRRTPWAREKVESLYLFMLRDGQRQAQRQARSASSSGVGSGSTSQSTVSPRRSSTR